MTQQDFSLHVRPLAARLGLSLCLGLCIYTALHAINPTDKWASPIVNLLLNSTLLIVTCLQLNSGMPQFQFPLVRLGKLLGDMLSQLLVCLLFYIGRALAYTVLTAASPNLLLVLIFTTVALILICAMWLRSGQLYLSARPLARP